MFKNIDPTVKQETLFMARIVLILSLLEQAVFLALGMWDYTVLLGNLYGAAIAVGNFFFMARTVAKALELKPEEAQKKMKLSQQSRLLVMLVLCVLGGVAPFLHTIALLVPQFFPRIAVAIRGATMKKEG